MISSDVIVLQYTTTEVGKERLPSWSLNNYWEIGQKMQWGIILKRLQLSVFSMQSLRSQAHFWFKAENKCILSFIEMKYKLLMVSWKSLWNPFNQMAAGRWNLSWCLSQTVGIISLSGATCGSADWVTTSEDIPFSPRVDDLNLLQPKVNKEMMKNRAYFFLSDVLRFENRMTWWFSFFVFPSKFSKLSTLFSAFAHSSLYILTIWV